MGPYDYGQTSSVTDIIQSLHWQRLDQRRIDIKLSLMYKITNTLKRMSNWPPSFCYIFRKSIWRKIQITKYKFNIIYSLLIDKMCL